MGGVGTRPRTRVLAHLRGACGPFGRSGIIVQLDDYLATAGIDANGIVTGAIFVLTVLLRKGIWGTVSQLFRSRQARPSHGRPRPLGTPEASGTPVASDAADSTVEVPLT